MSKRKYYLLVDTETTIVDTVADFGALVCDRRGNIYTECAVLVAEHYGKHELFHDKNSCDIWGTSGLEKRKDRYAAMLHDGRRMVASVNAINNWLAKANARFQPELTAYNLAFDADKCQKTSVNLDIFDKRFCLWHAATGVHAHTKAYREHVLHLHAFNPPTALGNMSFKTNAEIMAAFVTGEYTKEPHCAIEDCKGWELPILVDILKRKNWREKSKPYNWKAHQVNRCFTAKTGKLDSELI